MVFITGASGQIGSSTVIALSAKYADKVQIRAGARNPEKDVNRWGHIPWCGIQLLFDL